MTSQDRLPPGVCDQPRATDPGTRLRWASFISGIGERAAPADLAALRIDGPLRLRQGAVAFRGCTIEVQTPEGRPLGWLPREEADALAEAGASPDAAVVRVIGLVPAFQRPRIQVEVSLEVA